MLSILIAHRDAAFAEHLGSVLRTAGYRVVACARPWPRPSCNHSDSGACPRAAGADLMIFDPELTVLDAEGKRSNLTADWALAHPEIPMLLAWSPRSIPDLGTLRTIRAQAPKVHAAADDPRRLVRQIGNLVVASAVERESQ